MTSLRQLLLALVATVLAGSVVMAALVWANIYRNLPEIYDLRDYRPKLITHVLARDGTIVGELAEERRIVVPIEEVPDHLVKAFIAAEDDDFYNHEGLDYPSILRAAWENLKAGGVRQGGSTITQQVAKTFLLSSERTIVRKLKDMVLARRIEEYLQKNEILYLYLNQIYLGAGAYGVEAAARKYFGRPVGELTLAESALIAGLVPAPSRYSPRKSMQLARQRQRFVLRRMLEQEYITQQDHDDALAAEIVLIEPPHTDQPAAVAFFNEEVRRYMVAQYGEELVKTGGLSIKTTMDLEAQLSAYAAVRLGLRNHDRRTGFRGPEQQAPEEEWPDVLIAIAEANAKVPRRPGRIVQALVVEIDDDEERVRLDLGEGREALLTLEDVAWAREPDPDWDGAIPRVKKVSQALRRGWVVRLEHTGEIPIEGATEPDPETGAPPVQATWALFQEPQAEGALFSMEVATGEVQAIIGGYSFFRSQFDRAVQMRRQPGSAFKPIVYATALTRGFTPATIVYDTPIVYRDDETGFTWKPGNYSDKFYGPITLRQALAKSRNVATVKVLREIGIPAVIAMAESLGIQHELQPNLSLGLGSSEVTLVELVRAYGTFAAGGRLIEPIFILEVRDRDGALLEQNVKLMDALKLISRREDETPSEDEEAAGEEEPADDGSHEEGNGDGPRRADRPGPPLGDEVEDPLLALPPGYGIDPVTAYLMTDMLRAVVQEGTGWRAKALGLPTAGKTGTTNDLKDAWYVGFSPSMVAGVWVGFDEAANLGKNETGSRTASPIFVDYARQVLARQKRSDFAVPNEGVVFARIDQATGKIACAGDEKAIFQPFREGTVPIERAPCFRTSSGNGLAPRLD